MAAAHILRYGYGAAMMRPARPLRLLAVLLLLLQGAAAPAVALTGAAGGWLVELCAPSGGKRVVRVADDGRELPGTAAEAACVACAGLPLATPPAPPRLAGPVRWDPLPGWVPAPVPTPAPGRPAPPYAGRAPPALA